MAGLTIKQQVFLEEYLKRWNATEAARVANYKHPNVQGPRLLVNVRIREAIEARLKVKALEADEVLEGLSEIALGTMADFIKVADSGTVVLDIKKAEMKKKLQLIKKLNFKDGMLQSIELYDRQAALVQLGRHHKLFTDQILVDWREEMQQAGLSAGEKFELLVQEIQRELVDIEGSDNEHSTKGE